MVRLKRCLSGRRDGEAGALSVVVAASAVMVFILAALVVDLGLARDTRRQAQNSADASALAAGNALYNQSVSPRFTEAVQSARDFAAENFGVTAADWAACTDADALRYQHDSTNECITFENSTDPLFDATKPDRVRVRIPTEDVGTGLGVLAGASSVPISAEAEIGVRLESEPRCALCILGSGLHDIQNGDVTVGGGDIHFNGSVNVSSNGLVATSGDITVENTATGTMSKYEPYPQFPAPAIPDPLGFMSLPDTSHLAYKTGLPCAGGEGKYGGAYLRGFTCTLTPGLYVIGGGASLWDLAGNADTHLTGSGVTLYFTCGTPSVPAPCAPDEAGATMDASGNGRISITAPTSGPLKGLAIVFDRNNDAVLRMTGNGASGFQGTIYAPAATLEMNGNGCSTFDALIVVNSLEMNGNPSCLKSSYSGPANVDLPADQLHLTK